MKVNENNTNDYSVLPFSKYLYSFYCCCFFIIRAFSFNEINYSKEESKDPNIYLSNGPF